MKMIVGLGNPGDKYAKCRHNTGFIILDKFAEDKNLEWKKSEKFESEISEYEEYLLVKPLTFMNNSGRAVSKLANFYKINPNDITVIHDDVDIPFGSIKNQVGKNAAGHHGVEDIIEKLGTKDFARIRVGVGKPENKNIPVDEWVLQDFSSDNIFEIQKFSRTVESLL